MGAKLTAAQRRELMDIAGSEYRSHYADNYKPIIKLLELGYVDSKPSKYGGSSYAITPAGRAALSIPTPTHEGERK